MRRKQDNCKRKPFNLKQLRHAVPRQDICKAKAYDRPASLRVRNGKQPASVSISPRQDCRPLCNVRESHRRLLNTTRSRPNRIGKSCCQVYGIMLKSRDPLPSGVSGCDTQARSSPYPHSCVWVTERITIHLLSCILSISCEASAALSSLHRTKLKSCS